MRQNAADRDENLTSLPDADSEIQVNSGCIICYSQIADTVLLPCSHLEMCGVFYEWSSEYRL